MNTLKQFLKTGKSKEFIWNFLLLKALYEDNERELVQIHEILGEEAYNSALKILEESLYIKTINDKVVLRPEGLQLIGIDNSKDNETNEIITYLNTVCGRKFALTQSNKKFIRGRLEEGYTVEDCKRVIDTMNKQWTGNMRTYLRPETLFNATKFQTYINMEDNEVSNTEMI